MNTSARLGVYGLGLLILFGAALGLGRWAGPATPTAEHAKPEHGAADPHGDTHTPAQHLAPAGLQVAQDGYRLLPLTRELSTSDAVLFTFQIIGPDGHPLTAYTKAHDKDLHLIVVRRDLTGFQHLHPTLGPEGVWSVPIRVSQPGQFKVFADFQPAGRDKGLVLGVDVATAGNYQPLALPAPDRTATVDGYAVSLGGNLVPGKASKLVLIVTKDGRDVTDLQPYLAAYGHLVALRDGDLAYLHVHPDDSVKTAGPQIVFYAEVPSAGDYRLFLDFQHGDIIRTVAFTAVAQEQR